MILVFFLLNFLILCSSYTIVYRFFSTSSLAEKLVSTFLLYTIQISAVLLLQGVMVENLDLLPLTLVNALISILILIYTYKYIIPAKNDFIARWKEFRRSISNAKDFFLYIMLILFLGQVLWIIFKIYLLPPDVWDVFAYHLHPVVEWFQRLYIPDAIDTPVLRLNRNPMGPKLLHFWFVAYFKDMTWIELPQFLYGLWAAITSFAIMRKIEIPQVSALKYSILIYFIPLILIESRTCQDHLVLTTAILFSFLYIYKAVYENNKPAVVLLGLSFATILSAKISGPQVLLIFFFALLLAKGFSLKRIRDFIVSNAGVIIGGAVGMFLISYYWYFKDTRIIQSYITIFKRIWSPKPLAIIGTFLLLLVVLHFIWKKTNLGKNLKEIFTDKKVIIAIIILAAIALSIFTVSNLKLVKQFVFGYENPAPILSEKSFYIEHPIIKRLPRQLTKNILEFPFRMKDIGMYTAYTPDLLGKSGFGVQFFGFGILSYIMMLFLAFKRKYRTSPAGYMLFFSVILLLSYFVYYYSEASYRLYAFFPIIGIILWAFLYSKLNLRPFTRRYFDIILIVMILFNLFAAAFDGNVDNVRWKTALTIENLQDRTPIKYSSLFNNHDDADWDFIDRYIPPDEPIGYTGNFDSWVFPYFDNGMKRKIYYLPSLNGFNTIINQYGQKELDFNPGFCESLKHYKIRFIHINPQGIRSTLENYRPININTPGVYPLTKNLYFFNSKE